MELIVRVSRTRVYNALRFMLYFIKPRRDVHARGMRLSSKRISTACAVTRRNVYQAAVPCKIPSISPSFRRVILKYAKIN